MGPSATERGLAPGEEILELMQDDAAKASALLQYDLEQYIRLKDVADRRLYLYGSIGCDDDFLFESYSITTWLIEQIMAYNRADQGLPKTERKPIRLYIDSPGGDVTAGMALISAIEASNTPVYTINIGQWCSMAFLTGIAGDRRYALPSTTFLMHDGSSWAFGSTSKVQDRVKFEERFEREVIRKHVLKHSNMKSTEYDALARVEVYMLPEDALERGFIDVIATNIDDIL